MTALETVQAWLAGLNAGNAEAVLARTADEVAIIGPRGIGRGRDVLSAWMAQAGATFATLAIFAGGDSVVVQQRGTWRDSSSGSVRGQADVATRFRVVDAKVTEIQRYDVLASALRDAGLSQTDIQPPV